jgi:hypothetical protein
MATSETDNRIQLPPTEIDFDNVVGITGQAHDEFPAAGQQPRYDTMRSFLIGLLSAQSSEDPPTQYRTGTIWYNRTKQAYYYWDGSSWESLASAIAVSEELSSTGEVTILTLAQWFALAQTKLDSIQPRVVFGGHSVNNNVTSIPVPQSIQDRISGSEQYLRPFVYKNGVLIDPRLCSLPSACPTVVQLSGGAELDLNDNFTVVIQRVDLLVSDEVIAT